MELLGTNHYVPLIHIILQSDSVSIVNAINPGKAGSCPSLLGKTVSYLRPEETAVFLSVLVLPTFKVQGHGGLHFKDG